MTGAQRTALAVTLLAGVTALGVPLYRDAAALPAASICRGYAAAAAGVLHLAGVPVTRDAAILRHPTGFAIEVTPNCTGWFHVALYLAGLVALRPAKRPERTAPNRYGRLAVAGVGILAAVNLARLVLLYLAGGISARAFEWSHRVGGEALLAATVLLLWWRAGASQPGGASYPALSPRETV